jgi:hypothetical protein
MVMKKFVFAVIFLILSSGVFSLEFLREAHLKLFYDDPATYEYEFFSVDLGSNVDIISLGYYIGVYHQTHPLKKKGVLVVTNFTENNTQLSQPIKDKMRQLRANVSISTAFEDYLVVNLLLPNGTYTAIIFEPM